MYGIMQKNAKTWPTGRISFLSFAEKQNEGHSDLFTSEKDQNCRAFRYLVKKRGFQGSNMEYKSLKMAEYLSPLSTGISVEDKRKLFAIRNNMIDIPSNMKSRNENVKCLCGEKESQKHILECKLLNDVDQSLKYESIIHFHYR